jgi:hypothetical protein
LCTLKDTRQRTGLWILKDKKMKKIVFSIVILISVAVQKSFCQTVLLETDLSRDTLPQTSGENLKYFSHFFFGAGFIFGETNKELPVMNGRSYEFHAGFRTKRKVTPVYSYGFDFFYRAINYYIRQNAEKKFPDTLQHKSQKYNFFSLGAGVYNRFNFDAHRGNFLGTYADIGITAEWDFTARTVTHDVLPNDEKIKVIAKHFGYVNAFSSRVFLRAGRSKVVVYGAYRFTDHFKASSGLTELPRFIAGIELNIF